MLGVSGLQDAPPRDVIVGPPQEGGQRHDVIVGPPQEEFVGPPAREEGDGKGQRVPDEQIDAMASIRPLSESLAWNVSPRQLSLRDAIQVSLSKSDVVRTLSGGSVQIADATGYDPALRQQSANIYAAVFDPKLSMGYVGSRINEPSGTFFGPGIPQNVRRDEGDFIASVSKTWSTGASTSIGYLPPLGYLFYPLGTTGQFNPTYTSDLVITAQQPLMRGAGWTVNLAPIRIAQLRTEQSVWDVKEAVMSQVRSVEQAYWDLQAALITADALESVLPLMSEVVRIEGHRAKLEMSTAADVARASIQFDSFQQQRVSARNDAIAKELRLRNLMAGEVWDGTRVVPIDLPRSAPVPMDHASAVDNAMQYRPDLVRQRLGVRIRELEYAVARNGLKPQLDLQMLYRANGIGQMLDESLQQMLTLQYSDWTVGATFSVPLGRRAAKATMNAAELQLVRDRAVLAQSMQNVGFALADLIRESEASFSQFELALRRVHNSREWIRTARTRYATPPPSEDGNQNWLLLALYDYQNALRMHVDATSEAAQSLARYNTLLARLEEAQGVLLVNRGIDWSNDPCLIVKTNSDRLFTPSTPPPGPPAGPGAAPPAGPVMGLPPASGPMRTGLPASAYGAEGPSGIPEPGAGRGFGLEMAPAAAPAAAPSDPTFDYRALRQPYESTKPSVPMGQQPASVPGSGHTFEADRRWNWVGPGRP